MLEFEQGFNHLATLKVIGVGGGGIMPLTV